LTDGHFAEPGWMAM